MSERRYGPPRLERSIRDEPDPEIVKIVEEFTGPDGFEFPEIDEAIAAERERSQTAIDEGGERGPKPLPKPQEPPDGRPDQG